MLLYLSSGLPADFKTGGLQKGGSVLTKNKGRFVKNNCILPYGNATRKWVFDKFNKNGSDTFLLFALCTISCEGIG